MLDIGTFPFFILLIIIGLLFFVFWIIMLIDATSRKFKEQSDKIIWVLVTVLTGFIGALIYYFVIYRKDKSLAWFWYVLLGIFILLVLLIVFLYFNLFVRV